MSSLQTTRVRPVRPRRRARPSGATGGNWRVPLLLSIGLLLVGVVVSLRIDPRRRVAAPPSGQELAV